MSSIYNKFKDLNKGAECALNTHLNTHIEQLVFLVLLRDSK